MPPIRPKNLPKILVVDNDSDVLNSIYMILTNTFEVVVANSGSEALSLTSKDSYSTVIVDYRISGMDGTEFLSQLQLIDPLVSTILMTAIPSLEIASSGIRLGISEVDPENWTSG